MYTRLLAIFENHVIGQMPRVVANVDNQATTEDKPNSEKMLVPYLSSPVSSSTHANLKDCLPIFLLSISYLCITFLLTQPN